MQVWSFLKDNTEAILTLATLGLMAGTVALALYTRGLWGATLELARDAKETGQAQAARMESSVREAVRAADAMEASVAQARMAEQRQLRAYVSMRGYDVSIYPVGRTQIDGWRVTPHFENSGLTPAQDVSISISLETRDDKLPGVFTFPDVPVDTPPSVFHVGPRISFVGDSVLVERGVVMAVGMQQGRAYVWGHLDYNDVFPDTPRRTTRFAAEVMVRGDVFGNERETVQLRILDRFNDAT